MIYKKCKLEYRNSIFKKKLKNKYIILYVILKYKKKNIKLKYSYKIIKNEFKNMNIKSPTSENISKAVINIRKKKFFFLKKIGNAGSFFKNPIVSKKIYKKLLNKYSDLINFEEISKKKIKLSAGWFIEKLNWKGKKINNVGVHKKCPLILLNYGGAKGKDIYYLSNKIKKSIFNKFNIILETEVCII